MALVHMKCLMFLVEDHWQLSRVHTGFLGPALHTYKQPGTLNFSE